jgi:hypothetical protein
VQWSATLVASSYTLTVSIAETGEILHRVEADANATEVYLHHIDGGPGSRIFGVTAVDLAGLSTSMNITCIVDDQPPPTGKIMVLGSQPITEGFYAIAPGVRTDGTADAESGTRLICFDGFTESLSGIAGYELSLCGMGAASNGTLSCSVVALAIKLFISSIVCIAETTERNDSLVLDASVVHSTINF